MKIATIGNCQSGVIAKIMEKRIYNCHVTNFNISDCVGGDSIFKVEDYDVVFLQNALGVKFRHSGPLSQRMAAGLPRHATQSLALANV